MSADVKTVLLAYFGILTNAVEGLLTAARNDSTHEYDKQKALMIVALVRERGVAAFETLLARLEAL